MRTITLLAATLIAVTLLWSTSEAGDCRDHLSSIRLGGGIGDGDPMLFLDAHIIKEQSILDDSGSMFLDVGIWGFGSVFTDQDIYWAEPISVAEAYRRELKDLPEFWTMEARFGLRVPELPVRVFAEYWNVGTEYGLVAAGEFAMMWNDGRSRLNAGIGLGTAISSPAYRLYADAVLDFGLRFEGRLRYTDFSLEEPNGLETWFINDNRYVDNFDIEALTLELRLDTPDLGLDDIDLRLGGGMVFTNVLGGFEDVGRHLSLQEIHSWDDFGEYRPILQFWVRFANE